MTVNGPITPTDDTDLYPTHFPRYGAGSLRSVADEEARFAITQERREHGMVVFQEDTEEYWKLGVTLDNEDWSDFFSATVAGPTIALDNVAALRLVTAATVPDTALLETKGYYTSGDAGANRFRCDTADTTSPDNGGSVIWDGTTPTPRRWKKAGNVLNLFQWGCKNISGFDNTARIQAALDSGDAVFIGDTGISPFRFNSTLYFRTSGQAFYGLSNRSRLHYLNTGAGGPAFDNDTGTNLHYLNVHDFYLECNNNPPAALRLYQINNSHFYGLFIWFGQVSVLVECPPTTDGAYRNEFRFCYITPSVGGTSMKLTTSSGFPFGGNSTRIFGCWLNQNSGGIGLDIDHADNVSVIATGFEAGGTLVAADCCIRCNGKSALIEGCRFEPPNGTACAVRIEAGASATTLLRNTYGATWGTSQIIDVSNPNTTVILDSYFSEGGPIRCWTEKELIWGRGGTSFRPTRVVAICHEAALQSAGFAARAQSTNAPTFWLGADDADNTVKLNTGYSVTAPAVVFQRANISEHVFLMNGAKMGHYMKISTSAPVLADIPDGWFGFYMKGNKLCFTWNNGGTLRHGSFVMDGTNTAWTTTAA